MFKKLWDSEWTGAVGVVMSFIWEAFLLVGPPIGIGQSERKSYFIYGFVALFVCAIQSFSALSRKNRDLTQQLQEIEKTRPQIKPKEPAVHSKLAHHRFTEKNSQVVLYDGMVPFLCVAFDNDPLVPSPKSVAEGVSAYIQFFKRGGTVPVLQMNGRWVESDQPPAYSDFKSKAVLLHTSFGIGESRAIDIAYISGTDGKCYAWNNDNYDYFDVQYVYPKHLLTESSYRVRVRLRGILVDETFEFTFDIKANGFEFTQPLQVTLPTSKYGL
jgi:hypothetical protein